jgi:dipeptidyl aminopeptidase/acylaminoacyl peptidase
MVVPILATVLLLQAAARPGTTVTIEEYLQLRRLSAVQVSPDERAAVFTVTESDLAANQVRTRLYLWDVEAGTRVLAPGFTDARSPRWSPDGALLSFISAGPNSFTAPSSNADDDPGPQLWLLQHDSDGPATRLSELAGGVVDYGWAPDGSIYALSKSEDGQGLGFWRVQVPAGATEYVWGGDRGIRDMAVSPDGRAIVFSTNGTGTLDGYLNYDLKLLDLESRRVRELTSRPGSEVAPAWSPDSRTIVFRAPQDPRYPYSQTDLFSIAATGGAITSLTGSFDRAVLDHDWPPGGDLLFTAATGTSTELFVVHGNGAIELVAGGEASFGSPDGGVAGAEIYAVRESATEAPELWKTSGSGQQQLTQINARTRRWKLARQEVIRWTAPDGLSVEGVLVYPADYEQGRRYPLLVNVAGGPLSRARNVLDQAGYYQVFAAQGYAVLAPNFRGSRGYGEGFATAKRVDLAGGDLVDLLAGVDYVIGLGLADSTRLAIYGGSVSPYGAYLTSWTITQTRRFGAAVALFGLADPGFEPGHEASAPERALFRAGYLEMLERERSPLDSVRNVRTPFLIIEGATRSLVSSAQRMHRSLDELGRSAEYLELTSDRRETGRPRHRLDLFFRELRWFDRYLKFGGADLFSFHLVGEWSPGPGGWQLRVVKAVPRADYSGLRPDSGRYLEVTLALQPAEAAIREGTIEPLELDAAAAVSLVGPGGTRPLAGTVTQVFDRETLILGTPAPITVPVLGSGAPATVTFRLAFEIPDQAAEYRLHVTGFVPVRIWVSREH